MILRDAVHGLVAFESEEEEIVVKLLQTKEVQRLRRIRQLGVANVSFPGAEHTRFSHAVGTAHVMKLLIRRLRMIHEELPFWQRLTSDKARDVLAAALLHDLGHGPMSHLFEEALPSAPHHEVWSERVICNKETEVHKVLSSYDSNMPERVALLVNGKYHIPYLAKAVSGMIDVDRCDYLLRDAHFTGVGYGHFDLDWLLRSLRFLPPFQGISSENEAPTLAIDGAKGLPAVEAFLLARLFMFQQVYLHKATRSAEWMIGTALRRACHLVLDGAKLSSVPRYMQCASFGAETKLEDYLELDDAVLQLAMHEWENSSDTELATLCKRIRGRSLFKTLELFGEQASPEGRAKALLVAQDVAVKHGFHPHSDVGLDVASDVPFSPQKDPLWVAFQKGQPRKLEEVSFLLARLAEQELSRVRLVFAPELREAVTNAVISTS